MITVLIVAIVGLTTSIVCVSIISLIYINKIDKLNKNIKEIHTYVIDIKQAINRNSDKIDSFTRVHKTYKGVDVIHEEVIFVPKHQRVNKD